MLISENNPWLGLASYSREDAYRFFGRNKDLDEISATIKNNYCTILYGVSGAGKTSLVNAGLCPRLSGESFLPIVIRLDHNSSVAYARQLLTACDKTLSDSGCEVEIPVDGHEYDLSEEDRLWLYFHSATFWSSLNYKVVPVIIIDQFEEIFTLTESEDDIRGFFSLLEQLFSSVPSDTLLPILEDIRDIQLQEDPTLRMVLSMREDFLARLEDFCYDIPFLKKNRKGMRKLNGIQALSVIMDPVPGLVEREAALKLLSRVVGAPCEDKQSRLEALSVDTSILSLFCSEIYQKAVQNKLSSITDNLIDESGDDILDTFYKRNMDRLSKKGVKYLEQHLLTSSGFRNQVALEDIDGKVLSEQNIRDLEESRIIRKEIVNGTERIEFTHDVLCKVALKHRDGAREKTHNNAILMSNIGAILVSIALLDVLSILYSYSTSMQGIVYSIRSIVEFLLWLVYCFAVFPLCSSKRKSWSYSVVMSIPAVLIIFWNIREWLLWREFFLYYGGRIHIVPRYFLLLTIFAVVWSFFKNAPKSSFKDHLSSFISLSYFKESGFSLKLGYCTLLMGFLLYAREAHGILRDLPTTLAALFALPTYYVGRKLLLSKYLMPHSRKVEVYFAISSLVFLGCFVISQYSHHRVFTYMSAAASVINAILYEVDYQPISRRKVFFIPLRLIAIAGALIVFVGLPSFSMGYNLFGIGNNARSGRVGVLGVILESPEGKVGLYKRNAYVLPVKFNDILPYYYEGGNFKVLDDTSDDYRKWFPGDHIDESPYFGKMYQRDYKRHPYLQNVSYSFLKSTDISDYELLEKWASEHFINTYLVNLDRRLGGGILSYENYKNCRKGKDAHPAMRALVRPKMDAVDVLRSGSKDIIYHIDREAFSESVSDILSTKCIYSKDFLRNLLNMLEDLNDNTKRSFLDISQVRLLLGDYSGAYTFAEKSLTAIDEHSSAAIESVSFSKEQAYIYMIEAEELNALKTAVSFNTVMYRSSITRVGKPYERRQLESEVQNYAYVGDIALSDINRYADVWGLTENDLSKITSDLSGYRANLDFVSQHPYGNTRSLLIADSRADEDNYYNARLRSHQVASSECISSRLYYRVFHPASERFGVYFLDRKRGYIDFETGQELTDNIFDHAWAFSEGVAVVEKDGKLGIINDDGTYRVKPTIPCYYPSQYYEVLLFHDGYLMYYGQDGRVGLIDKNGKWALPPVFNTISSPVNGYRVVSIDEKTKDYSVTEILDMIKKGEEKASFGYYGILGPDLKLIRECKYFSIVMDENGVRIKETEESEAQVLKFSELQ